MSRASRGRNIGIAAASVATHAVLLTLVALHAPRLISPPMASGPPEAIIPVLIVAKVPPSHTAAPGARPAPLRLHRRPLRFDDASLPVAPLVAPTAEVKRPAPADGPSADAPSPARDALTANVRSALRSRVGCDNPGLTRAEREGCLERLGAGAREAPFLGLGVERGRAGELAAAAARRERDFRYMRSSGPPGTTGAGPSANGNAVGRGNNLPGSTAKGIGAMVGSDNPAYKVPF